MAQIQIETKNEKEPADIERALTNPRVLAFCVVVGMLMKDNPELVDEYIAYALDHRDDNGKRIQVTEPYNPPWKKP